MNPIAATVFLICGVGVMVVSAFLIGMRLGMTVTELKEDDYALPRKKMAVQWGDDKGRNVTFNEPSDAREVFAKIDDLDDLKDKLESNG